MAQTLLDRLTAQYPQAKRTTLREMVQHKRVLLNGAIARSVKQAVEDADRLEVLDMPAAPQATPLARGLRLVHFDAHIILVDKSAGLLTSTDPSEKRPTVLAIVNQYFRRQNAKNQVHLIHRLDRDASGLLIFARNWDAFASLKQQFYEHTITRRYDVIAHGIPKKPAGRLENLLIEDPQTGKVTITKDLKRGKLAILDYLTLDVHKTRRLAHLQCTLFTGKKHQIRVQLLAAGHAVCGDPLYGNANEPPHRLALHASHLSFQHPGTRRKVAFDSPMPRAFSAMLR